MDTSRVAVAGATGPDGAPVFRFNDAAIQHAIDESLKTLGEDKVFATVGVKAEGSVHFAAAVRLGDHWSMAGFFEHTKAGNSGAVGVRLAR